MDQSEIIKLAKEITSLPKNEGDKLFLKTYGSPDGREKISRVYQLSKTAFLNESEKKRINELVATLRFVG